MNIKILIPLCLLLVVGAAVLILNQFQVLEREAADETELTEEQIGMFLQFERKVKDVRQSVQNGIMAEDKDHLIQAAQKSLVVFDLAQELEEEFPQAEGLKKTYEEFYARLVSIITLFMENRLEQGRARLMELEQSHVFVHGKLEAILDSVTGEGCVPCFEDL